MSGSITRSAMSSSADQIEARTCVYCKALFLPKRLQQLFCTDKCRSSYHIDVGIEGRVASVRRINRGASLVIHLSGPAAEAALGLKLRDKVRVVSKP